MKQKLWIFGDSYADQKTNYQEMEQITWEGWTHWLKADYDVENFALSGTSGDTCFLRLANKVDEYQPDELKDISVVFILADVKDRVPLTGYTDDQQWSFMFNAYPEKEYNDVVGNLDTWPKYHSFAKTFISDYMETDEYQNRIKLFLGALDHYASFFKKFICITVDKYEVLKKGWGAKHKFAHMEFRHDLTLEDLSNAGELPSDVYLNEFGNGKHPKHLYPNHLDERHNKKMYTDIKQWMK